VFWTLLNWFFVVKHYNDIPWPNRSNYRYTGLWNTGLSSLHIYNLIQPILRESCRSIEPMIRVAAVFYSNHLHISIKVAIIHLQLGMVIIVLPTLVGWSDSDKYQEPIQYALQWMLRGIHITQIWHGKKHWAYKNHEISPKIKISIFSFHSYIKRYSFLL